MILLCLPAWFGFVLILILGSIILMTRRGKAQIQAYLQARGARNITTEYRWLGSDRNRNTYIVTYEDAAGHFHRTKCVTSNTLWGNNDIYWLDSPRGTEQAGVMDEMNSR
ncbi:MAG: hypothetical protein U0350_01210 [Caldilineaceae bacterium]